MRTLKIEFFIVAVIFNTWYSTNIYAQQNCDSILIGIHQQEFVSSKSNKLKNTLDILKKYESSSYEQARNTATSAGFTLPLEELPVSFQLGYKTDSKDKGNWVNQLETYFSSHIEEASNYTRQIDVANKNVVTAWSECVNDRYGVIAWPEQYQNGGSFVILIGYRPTSREVAKIEEIDFGDQFEPLTDKKNYINKELSFDFRHPIVVQVKRKASSNAQGQIVIRTTQNQAYINLLPFPEINKVSLPPRPQIDFDNDRLSDSYGFVGSNPYSIEVTLGNGQKIKTNLPSGYNPFLPQVQFVTGDFNGDNFTDLIAIVTSDAHYAHIHLSKGDGSFYPNKQFYFRPATDPTYNTEGTWESKYCSNLGKSVLHHIPPPERHDLRVTDGYYWKPGENGTAFSISSKNPCQN